MLIENLISSKCPLAKKANCRCRDVEKALENIDLFVTDYMKLQSVLSKVCDFCRNSQTR